MEESDKQPDSRPAWHYILLWVIALASLALNIYLLVGLNHFQQVVRQEAGRASEILDRVTLENLEVPVAVDETLDVAVTIPFSDTIAVPINTTIPVSTSIAVDETISVPIDEVVNLDRNVQINLSVLGQSVPVTVPINADVPVTMDIEVPVNLEVPVEAEIPIDLLIEVPVNTELPIETQIPVQMDFPVTVPLKEMGLDELLGQMQEGLRQLAGAESK
ncbi:MAG: hypothetical protein ACK2UF_09525 [Candidatus Promineifilaceae bacterium]|jgi:hypothetical protein